MVDTHIKSKQNQFFHLDTKKILSAPLYILLASKAILTLILTEEVICDPN